MTLHTESLNVPLTSNLSIYLTVSKTYVLHTQNLKFPSIQYLDVQFCTKIERLKRKRLLSTWLWRMYLFISYRKVISIFHSLISVDHPRSWTDAWSHCYSSTDDVKCRLRANVTLLARGTRQTEDDSFMFHIFPTNFKI